MVLGPFHLGMRTVKTGIAVFICILLSFFIFHDSPMLSSLAAIFTIRENLSTSYIFGKARLLGILVAGLVAGVFILLVPIRSGQDPHLIWLVPLAIMAFITLANGLKVNKGLISGSATLLVIFFNIPLDHQLTYAATRVLETAIGVVVALVVNYLLPHHHQAK